MLKRYSTTGAGNQKKIANIYTVAEHGIFRTAIDRDALAITRRLNSAGHDAYIVGGAVRDLLLNREPKDFDVVTDALPRKIRRLFGNSRIIGKRFRLVHVYFREKIVEVSTFRADHKENNMFGTMAEDVGRRDFTINALYYDPRDENIIDYVDGFDHIKEGKIQSLVPLEISFPEDPVRMIRAVRYATIAGFTFSTKITRAIRKYASQLSSCPISRLTEEIFKILESGYAAPIFRQTMDLGLFRCFLPRLESYLSRTEHTVIRAHFFDNFAAIDEAAKKGRPAKRSDLLVALVSPFLPLSAHGSDPALLQKELYSQVKQLIQPLTPANVEVEKAVSDLLGGQKKRPPRRRRRR